MGNIKEYNNLIAFHPGNYIDEIIDDLNITQKEFAEKLDITEKRLSQLINGKSKVSTDIAYKLSAATGMSIGTWQNLQSQYDKKIIEIEKIKELEINKKIMNKIDYKYFMDLNLVEEKSRVPIKEKIDNLLRIFSISSLTYLTKSPESVSYRNKSQNFDKKTIINSNIMLEIASNHANLIDAPKYDEIKLRDIIKNIKKLTMENPNYYYNKLKEDLFDSGIILVALPHLRNAGINGAVKKLKSGSILLMINDRGKDADIFWFSLLHEVSHILNNEYEVNLVGNSLISENEQRADEFARNVLIDKEAYKLFINKNLFDRRSVLDFAKDQEIHPGIVVGRLQNDKLIGYHELYDLKEKIIVTTKKTS